MQSYQTSWFTITDAFWSKYQIIAWIVIKVTTDATHLMSVIAWQVNLHTICT